MSVRAKQECRFLSGSALYSNREKAGRRLYTHFELGHEELFRIAATFQGDFLVTYNHTEEMRNLAVRHGFATRLVAMKNTHHAIMTELLISRNLDWV